MKILRLIPILFSLYSADAALWYVDSAVVTSGNGNSWATAWKSPSAIQWGSIAAGDTIYFDGGASGKSYAAFSLITASGNSGAYITIARSLETGRDGIVTFATPCSISGSYIKFDGGGYKLVSGNTYRCGIVFTCSSATTSPQSFTGGQAINIGGARPWMRYVYFNGTYAAGQGNSFGVRNNTGFILDHCWFYQSSWEDQWSYEASGTGGALAITNTVFQDNNKPNRSDTSHRDVANTWTGSGGYSMYIVANIFFNTPGHASDQPQGDELLLQVGYPSGSGVPLTAVIAYNNVCYGTARFIAFGSGNTGANSFIVRNNTIRSVINGDSLGITGLGYTSGNNIGNSTSGTAFLAGTSPLGSDGIPFTADDGFSLTSSSTAIDAGSNVGIPLDIRGNTRAGNPDLGAYEFGGGGGPSTNPIITLSAFSKDFGRIKVGNTTNVTLTITNSGSSTLAGVASVSAPFSVSAGANYSMPNGSNHSVTITYTPTVQGVHAADVTFTGGGGATFSLDGMAYTNQSGFFWQASNALIVAPMTLSSGLASHTEDSSGAVPSSGYAFFAFNAPSNGYYYFQAAVRATNASSDSFFVGIDAVPVYPSNTWDVLPLTTGVQVRAVGKRGGGTFDVPHFPTNVVYLTSGDHYTAFYYREPNAAISNLQMIALSTNTGTAPVFLGHPQNLRVIQTGADSIDSFASGTLPLTYQWWNDQGVVSGETTESLAIDNAQQSDEGNYWVVANNAYGFTTSAIAVVTVVGLPVMTIQPTNVVGIKGQLTTTYADGNADDGIPEYFWRSGGVELQGQNTRTLTFNPSELTDSGQYTFVLRNEAGSVTSNPVNVTIVHVRHLIAATANIANMVVNQ